MNMIFGFSAENWSRNSCQNKNNSRYPKFCRLESAGNHHKFHKQIIFLGDGTPKIQVLGKRSEQKLWRERGAC